MKFTTYGILLSSAISAAIGAVSMAHYRRPNFQGPSALLRRDVTCSANLSCPLNACCSKYGHCGLTDDFCGSDCVNGCQTPLRPKCSSSNDTGIQRMVGYYESWAGTRPCQRVAPGDLNVTGFTHINYGFLLFDPTTFQIASADENGTSPFTTFTDLKKDNPGLETWVSIGGWAFNDPGATQDAFSNMVACESNRSKFIAELSHFMETYAFDGADLDWEYPAAPDRGGRPEDVANYAALAKEIQTAFRGRYGLSMTLPASFFYLKNFDIAVLQRYVSFFNVMTYDLHGVWDSTTQGVGPYIRPHTNLTEIDAALDLIWRSKIDPAKINLGLAWYGRSFTLQDANCTTPNGVCKFSDTGLPGPCTQVAGTLNMAEIQDIVVQYNLTPELDRTAAIKYTSWNNSQWVAYDDAETIQMKLVYARSLCLGGAMVWAMDQADQKTSCGLSKAVRLTYKNDTTASAFSANGMQICELATVSNVTTCEDMARFIGNATVTQFKAWNLAIGGSCDNLTVGEQVCVSPPGGWYVIAPPPLAGSAIATSSMSSPTITIPTSLSCTATSSSITFLSNISQLASTPTSTSTSCSLQSPVSYAPWRNGTTSTLPATTSLASIQSTHTQTVTTFVIVYGPTAKISTSSPSVVSFSFAPTTSVPTAVQSTSQDSTPADSASTESTNTASIAAISGSQTLALSAISTTGGATSAQSTPGLYTQPGIPTDCDKFAVARLGDTCDKTIAEYGLKAEDFYAWNPSLGEGGKYCSTLFWARYSYCVSVSGSIDTGQGTGAF